MGQGKRKEALKKIKSSLTGLAAFVKEKSNNWADRGACPCGRGDPSAWTGLLRQISGIIGLLQGNLMNWAKEALTR